MKNYTTPQIAELGDVQQLTGLFGSSTRVDVLVNPNGNVVQRGTGSIDACPTQNPAPGGQCIVRP
ncbi:MAG: hypothetical protein ACK41D_04770 [Rubricoccaceae bacterium]